MRHTIEVTYVSHGIAQTRVARIGHQWAAVLGDSTFHLSSMLMLYLYPGLVVSELWRFSGQSPSER